MADSLLRQAVKVYEGGHQVLAMTSKAGAYLGWNKIEAFLPRKRGRRGRGGGGETCAYKYYGQTGE